MTKFKSIEDEKKYWKVKFDKLSNTGQLYRSGFASGLLRGIDLAHEYDNKLSNTQMHMDACKCDRAAWGHKNIK